MSMMQPGLGDLIDRLFILKRKEIDGQSGNGVEMDLLREALHLPTPATNRLVTIVELCTINAAIWQRTDEARRHTDDSDEERKLKAHKAHSLLPLNDSRHIIVNLLNKPDGLKE